MKFYLEDTLLPVVKCKRPSFSDHRGRTWDVTSFFIDGVKTNLHLDTTWGHYVYFQYGEDLQWYKVKMCSSSIEDMMGKSYDFDPFSTPKPCVIIK